MRGFLEFRLSEQQIMYVEKCTKLSCRFVEANCIQNQMQVVFDLIIFAQVGKKKLTVDTRR